MLKAKMLLRLNYERLTNIEDPAEIGRYSNRGVLIMRFSSVSRTFCSDPRPRSGLEKRAYLNLYECVVFMENIRQNRVNIFPEILQKKNTIKISI